MPHPRKIKIFISYSRYDKKILAPPSFNTQTEFIRRLKALEKEEGAEVVWDSDMLRAGDLFDEEIKSHLKDCDILLALVSQNFLESRYCTEVEVEAILARRRNGHRVVIVPFYLSHCEWWRVDWLKDRHALPSPDRPFWSIRNSEKRNEELLLLKGHLRDRIRLLRGGAAR